MKRGKEPRKAFKVPAEIVDNLERGEGVLIAPGKLFYARPVASLDSTVFTALRPERLPLEDAEVEAEIERLKALPLAEYEAQREPAASRLGVRLSLLDRLRSDGAKEEAGTAVPQRAADAAPSATLSATERRLAAEKECERLLIERYEAFVRNGRKREERPFKDKIRTEMTELIAKLSGRSFDKCWKATAVAQCWTWTLPGQR